MTKRKGHAILVSVRQKNTMTTIRNRVKTLADERGWDVREIFRQAVTKNITIALGTIYRYYGEPDYLGTPTTLDNLAKVFDVAYGDIVERVEAAPEQPNT